jgi:hypothetical protein
MKHASSSEILATCSTSRLNVVDSEGKKDCSLVVHLAPARVDVQTRITSDGQRSVAYESTFLQNKGIWLMTVVTKVGISSASMIVLAVGCSYTLYRCVVTDQSIRISHKQGDEWLCQSRCRQRESKLLRAVTIG